MAIGFAKWNMKVEGREPTPKPKVQHELNDYLRDRLEPDQWGNIEPGRLGWLGNAFGWAWSPQGVDFWHEVIYGRGDQGLACEILQSWKEQLEWERGTANG